MNEYSQYGNELRNVVDHVKVSRNRTLDIRQASQNLDGMPAARLRQLVPQAGRRASSAFFTGSSLREALIQPIAGSLNERSRVLDPACGAGDLLLAAARHLPLDSTYRRTLASWGDQIWGYDIHPEFVDVAKLRLELLLLNRWSQQCPSQPIALGETGGHFPNVIVRDGLKPAPEMIPEVTHLVLNPPFHRAAAAPDCDWAQGKTSLAATFLDAYTRQLAPGVRIAGILPDVLRSGSLYEKWRRNVASRVTDIQMKIVGQFDKSADVDVFTFHGVCGPNTAVDFLTVARVGNVVNTFGHHFAISVGPLVPFRETGGGRWSPLASSGTLSGTTEIRSDCLPNVRSLTRKVAPPFIAIRRTSAPSDSCRPVAVLVTGTKSVAVENHILIAAPNDGSEETCRYGLMQLNQLGNRRWLDERIRCRHLTVASIKEVPWLPL